MPVVFQLIKMSVWVPQERLVMIFGEPVRPKVFGKWTENP